VIAVLNYEAGNLASVCKALTAVGGEARLVREPAEAQGAAAIVAPGVGHFGATAAIGDGWRTFLRAHVRTGRPLLGICLGMQWLFEASEEAPGCPGLGVLPGTCRRLENSGPDPAARVKVPHVGWNSLQVLGPSGVLAGVADAAYVYFTHSYAAPVGDECVAVVTHGGRFAAAVEHGPVWGTQFHPEKSGETGLQILRNFVAFASVS
jgi:imidazole glycerol-phosphate synthase subunit HisH